MSLYGIDENDLELARKNIMFIKDEFTRLEVSIDLFVTPDKEQDIKDWIRNNAKGLVLSQDSWRLLVDYDLEEPTMSNILASIRRIIAEDSGTFKKLVYYIHDPDDVMMFKLAWI